MKRYILSFMILLIYFLGFSQQQVKISKVYNPNGEYVAGLTLTSDYYNEWFSADKLIPDQSSAVNIWSLLTKSDDRNDNENYEYSLWISTGSFVSDPITFEIIPKGTILEDIEIFFFDQELQDWVYPDGFKKFSGIFPVYQDNRGLLQAYPIFITHIYSPYEKLQLKIKWKSQSFYERTN